MGQLIMPRRKITVDYEPDIGPTGHLIWLHKIIDKSLYTPYIIKCDNDYYTELRKKYNLLYNLAYKAKVDFESLNIIDKFTNKILEAVRIYYKGRISASQTMIENLIRECISNELAVNTVNNSYAFPGIHGEEIQFYHARLGTPAGYDAKEMLHLPYTLRSRTQNNRFGILGVPSYYLANSSYCCWLEMGMPSEHEFNVSPVVLDGTQQIFNLAFAINDFSHLNELDSERVHTWLKLIILMMASSFRVKEDGRNFKSEYIIPQSIMLACKELKLDGIAYYSNRVEQQAFAQVAINLVLFTTQEKFGNKYSNMCDHLKVGDGFNYFMFEQLGETNQAASYNLHWMTNGRTNNIGTYKNQFYYILTDFCRFDMFLFERWKEKDKIEFGNAAPKKKKDIQHKSSLTK